jgi:tetratricopeptide (TPR) repeat protein
LKADVFYKSIFNIDEVELRNILGHLIKRRILRFNPITFTYSSHPLIRAHYNNIFNNNFEIAIFVYKLIKNFYLNESQKISSNPMLDDLTPLIEYVHYACIAGDYDEAIGMITKHKGFSGHILIGQLGAYETGLDVLSEFFPDKDIYQEPLVTSYDHKGYFFNNIGLCLAELGRPSQAILFFERSIKIDLKSKKWKGCSVSYRNLAVTYSCLGSLVPATEASQNSLRFARRSGDIVAKANSIALKAWISYLKGDLRTAKSDFRQAETIQKRTNQKMPYLDDYGIEYAICLFRAGEFEEARKRTEYNLRSAENKHLIGDIISYNHLLGDIEAEGKDYETANFHFDEAIRNARNGSSRILLIESLVSRGRFMAKHMRNAQVAFCDLSEALDLAILCGYLIYEADIRVATAWAHLVAGNLQSAKEEAEKAKKMSVQMGYHWGMIDSEEVRAGIQIESQAHINSLR